MKLATLLTCWTLSLWAHSEGIQEVTLYHQNANLQRAWADETIARYDWRGDERVLDVGCGDGEVLATIASKVPRGFLVGLDISSKMVGFASRNFPYSRYPNMLFMQGNATLLPFCEQFDLIVSFCTLHWVLDQKKAFQDMRKTLVDEGKLLLVIPAKTDNTIGASALRLVQKEKWASYFPDFKSTKHYPTENECRKLLLETGFTPLSIRLTTADTLFRNKEAFLGYLKPLVNFIDHLPADLQATFLDELADEMLALDLQTDPQALHYKLDKLEIIAAKQ